MTQDLTLMQAAIQKMHWHEERQKVLSQNIANADTPGYIPQDIEKMDFKGLLQSSTSQLSLRPEAPSSGMAAGQMLATNPKHMGLNGKAPTSLVAKQEKNPYETSPSGNAVILEEQLLKMNQNDTDHRLTTTIYQKNLDMLKTALRSQ